MADLALALLQGDAEAIHRARGAAVAFSADPFVQFELGLAHANRNDFTAAAQAFDRCTEADPRFAYAYYYAGLAYDRLNRADLMINRLEMFSASRTEAPERPEVESILQTVRRR
jgi:lipoprotein NlpI